MSILVSIPYNGVTLTRSAKDWHALATQLAEAEAREQLLLKRCDQLEADHDEVDTALAEAEALLRATSERLHTLNDATKSAQSAAVVAELMLSVVRINSFLNREKP